MDNILYVILGVIGFFILLQVLLKFRAWRKKGKAAPDVGGALGRAIQKGDKLIAYFYSPTCRACKTQEKFLPKLDEGTGSVFRINAAKEGQIASAFGIMGTPTTVVIEKGIIKNYFVGVTATSKLIKSLKS